MLRRPSFWMAFFYLVCLSAVGSSVISFARDLALCCRGASCTGYLAGRRSVHLQWPGPNGHWRCLRCPGQTEDHAHCQLSHHLLPPGSPHCHVDWYLGAVCLGLCDGTELWLLLPTGAHSRCVLWHEALSHQWAYMTFNLLGGSLVATLSSLLLTATGGLWRPSSSFWA